MHNVGTRTPKIITGVFDNESNVLTENNETNVYRSQSECKDRNKFTQIMMYTMALSGTM